MNDNGAAFAYRETTAQSASAVGRVVALFDTILRDFQRALVAIDEGKIEARVFELNHALTVIGELQGVLDYQRGGEAARRFERFYNVARALIMNANAQVSHGSVLELIELFKPIRQAWQEVDQKLANVETIETRKAPQGKPAASTTSRTAAPLNTNTDAQRSTWSA
jgi:flagellar protein FliS